MIRLWKNNLKFLKFIIGFILLLNTSLTAAGNSENYNNQSEIDRNRLLIAGSSMAAGYTTTFILLDYAWYRNYPRSSFHFHNDNADWLQMDKMGHVTSTYYLSGLSYKVFKWTGMSNRQANLWGSISSWVAISTIEVFDGFSAEWGASYGDIIANTIGALTFAGQQATWKEQRIKFKYSYHRSGLDKYRPDLLGSSLAENMLKDYNAHTHWLSFNISSFGDRNSAIPSWLNIAVGYGAYGMLGSTGNPDYYNGEPLPHFERTRHFYISPDIDWSRINTNSVFLQSFFSVFDFFKMPAPAIEYNKKQGFVFHLLFF